MNRCYNCKHWRLYDVNAGGLFDIGICAKKLVDTSEGEGDSCRFFEKQDSSESSVQMMLRKQILDVYRRVIKMYSVDKEKVAGKVLEEIKQYILKGESE